MRLLENHGGRGMKTSCMIEPRRHQVEDAGESWQPSFRVLMTFNDCGDILNTQGDVSGVNYSVKKGVIAHAFYSVNLIMENRIFYSRYVTFTASYRTVTDIRVQGAQFGIC